MSRRRKSDLFSPVVLGGGVSTVSRINPPSPSELLSPSTQRNGPALSALTNTPSVLSPATVINNNLQDKKERRRSKVLELQRRHINSPAAGSPANRIKSVPNSGMSNQQLAEHYSSCIKLSAENKITSKNAFGLHLIDYMAELLRKKDMNNFQVASSTLDASAKIYAGRVDAIHTETYKVLSGLGRTGGGNEKQDRSEGGGGGEGDAGEDDAEREEREGERKRKRAKKSKTIETNPKNINVPKLDLEFEVDPLFSKTSAAFDEGGTGGLMMNHLQILDDTSELVLDSNTVMISATSMITHPVLNRVSDLSDFRSTYCGVQLDNIHICPSFRDFSFTNWKQEDDEDAHSISMLASSQQSSQIKTDEHAFDLDAEAEPIPDTDSGGGGGEFMDDFGNMGDDNEDNDAVSVDMSDMGDNQEESKMVQHMMKDMKSGTFSTLMQILEPSDYSYFNNKLFRTWAGPDHWKLKTKSKDATQFSTQLGENTTLRGTKEKKEAFSVSYDEKIDFDAYYKERRAATTLTKATVDRYNKSSSTLPEDLHYATDKLFKLFVKARMMLKRKHESDDEQLDEGVGGYDYDNAADAAGFCPASQEEDDDDDDDDNEMGFDMTAGLGSQEGVGSQEPSLDGTQLGDKLVEAPRKVAQLDINYAKAAKKMDVKKLKSSMWNLLVQPEKHKENEGSESEASPPPPAASEDAKIEEPHSFQKLVETLPGKLSKSMATNLSVPIAFVCLLHLANDKCLSITSDPDMADLQITQG